MHRYFGAPVHEVPGYRLPERSRWAKDFVYKKQHALHMICTSLLSTFAVTGMVLCQGW